MLLSRELKALACGDSPRKFRERLIDAIQRLYPDWTIDDLVCEPESALAYCEAIRGETECSRLHDVVILKTLMNIRRSKACPPGLKRNRTVVRLTAALRDAGIDLGEEQFRELLVDSFSSMYKSRTVDEILCHPHQAMDFYRYIQRRIDPGQPPIVLVLRTLMNVRKRGSQTKKNYDTAKS